MALVVFPACVTHTHTHAHIHSVSHVAVYQARRYLARRQVGSLRAARATQQAEEARQAELRRQEELEEQRRVAAAEEAARQRAKELRQQEDEEQRRRQALEDERRAKEEKLKANGDSDSDGNAVNVAPAALQPKALPKSLKTPSSLFMHQHLAGGGGAFGFCSCCVVLRNAPLFVCTRDSPLGVYEVHVRAEQVSANSLRVLPRVAGVRCCWICPRPGPCRATRQS